MSALPPRSTLTDTLCPYTTLFRSSTPVSAVSTADKGSPRATHSMIIAVLSPLMPQEAMTGPTDSAARQASSFAAAIGGRFRSYLADLREGVREPRWSAALLGWYPIPDSGRPPGIRTRVVSGHRV